MIRLNELTKKFGDVTAVDHLTFDVKAGVVTGFLGPNGSGKSTTMRMILGLDRPTSGSVSIDGKSYHDLPYPLREVGALLDAKAVHPSRSARNHLRALALSNDIKLSRVDEVLDLVGLTSVANKRAGEFSLGMGQRLGIAGALLGDPRILLFDEPVNGLDPEGIRWVRELFQSLAAEGRTVFVSSHLMSEMELTADEIIAIGRGKLIRQGTVTQLTQEVAGSVLVRTPEAKRFADILTGNNIAATLDNETTITVTECTSDTIGELAAKNSVVLHELTPQKASLEEVFMDLTSDAVEFQGASKKAAE